MFWATKDNNFQRIKQLCTFVSQHQQNCDVNIYLSCQTILDAKIDISILYNKIKVLINQIETKSQIDSKMDYIDDDDKYITNLQNQQDKEKHNHYHIHLNF